MQHSAQLQLSDLWGILIGIVLFILMLGWREIAEWMRVGVNRFVIVRHVDMSSEGGTDDDRTGTDDGRTDLVLTDTYQPGTGTALENESSDFLRPGHNHTRSQWIKLLSTELDGDGGYKFSKNKIADFVGGTRAEVLAEIDRYRPRPAAPPARSNRLERPAGGW